MEACIAIDQYCKIHWHQCSPEDFTAYKAYAKTRWMGDYGWPGFQLYYAYRLFERRVTIAETALRDYLDDVEDGTTVVSIGCGPGPELAAAHGMLGRFHKVDFLGIDCESGWENLYRVWTTHVATRNNMFDWLTMIVTDEETLVNLLRVKKASVVIFSYFLFDFGRYLNPRRLMERVPTLKQIFVFDCPGILGIDDRFSTDEHIYRDQYRDERPYENSRKERTQVLVYSRRQMQGFVIMHRYLNLYAELSLHLGTVRRTPSPGCGYQILVPFTLFHCGTNFRSDFVNLVAPYLAAALPQVHAMRVVTDWFDWCFSIGDWVPCIIYR